jgi:Protein of unknown function (DUF1549)/Protein of unknown function (DUF1553)
MNTLNRVIRSKLVGTFCLGLLVTGSVLLDSGPAAAQKKGKKAPPNIAFQNKPVAPHAPKTSVLTEEAWQKAPLTPLEPGELDQLVNKELVESKIAPAPLTTDEQFVRRVTLDLTGQLPTPADVKEFIADPASQKRSLLIDKLLASDEFAQHWARYWRDVVASRINERRGLGLARSFEEWMNEELKKNAPWDQIVRAMLTAEGSCSYDADGKNGAIFFLAGHVGPDSVNEQAAETARVFLGIQIQCAQCHDHPQDQWKRVQFHELAAYFARTQQRPMRTPDAKGPQGMEIISQPRGEHEMPSSDDPKKTFLTHPRYLDGTSPGANLTDQARRRSLANAVTSKKNYWFAGAYVNRIWGELMGQSFYQPVDDMGPKKEAVFASVLTRLTGAFRGTNYDVKDLFRSIMNSQTYQRQIRPGESSDQHLHFAAAYPTRLRADALWGSLTTVLGSLNGGAINRPRPQAKGALVAPGLEGLVVEEFKFDPSLKADEVEGSIPQALLLMNNPLLNQKITARGTNVLSRILTSYPEDTEAIKMVYLKTLARKPSDREVEKFMAYMPSAHTRGEAYEDLLWAILNSTEFQTKR